MSRREQNYSRVVRNVVTSSSSSPITGGIILPTYSSKVKYSARDYYNERNTQNKSPTIRTTHNTSGDFDRTPVNNKQGQLMNNQDLQKTQKGNRSSLQTSGRESQRDSHRRAANLIKRYSSGGGASKEIGNSGMTYQKHSVETVDVLNKKYGLGLNNSQNTVTKTQKKKQPYGYDSGVTYPQNYQINSDFNKTEGAQNNYEDAQSNDIESENIECDSTAQKPIYQKETKIIQRRETVDPAVINRNGKDYSDIVLDTKGGKSNGNSHLAESEINIKPEVVIQDRERTQKIKKQRQKNPLSVISSEVTPSKEAEKKVQTNININIGKGSSNIINNTSSKFQNFSSKNEYVKDSTFDDRMTVASARESDFYFQKYDSIPINDYLRYIGPIKNGKFHGLGRIITSKGEIVYEGEFYQGKYDGKGKLWNFLKKSKPKQISIQAEIVANYMTLATTNYLKDLAGDKGILNVNFTEDNWEFYRGYFKDGKKHGCGKLKLADGRIYEGEFVNGLANGYGMLHYFEKSLAGRWKDNILVQFL